MLHEACQSAFLHNKLYLSTILDHILFSNVSWHSVLMCRKAVNQSVNQSVSQSVSLSQSQSVSQSVSQSINQSTLTLRLLLLILSALFHLCNCSNPSPLLRSLSLIRLKLVIVKHENMIRHTQSYKIIS